MHQSISNVLLESRQCIHVSKILKAMNQCLSEATQPCRKRHMACMTASEESTSVSKVGRPIPPISSIAHQRLRRARIVDLDALWVAFYDDSTLDACENGVLLHNGTYSPAKNDAMNIDMLKGQDHCWM